MTLSLQSASATCSQIHTLSPRCADAAAQSCLSVISTWGPIHTELSITEASLTALPHSLLPSHPLHPAPKSPWFIPYP